MKIQLSQLEARVIGSLIEKQITTPDQYPLSLNALVNACNQKSNRDPVMELDESQVRAAAQHLGTLGYARLAADLGIDPAAIVVMDRAVDTEQEAREVAALLGQTPFVLVTSAYHMPRAMRLMRRAGTHPIPAPTGQILRAQHAAERFGLIPGSRGLRKTETALHEYLGLAAIGLRVDH